MGDRLATLGMGRKWGGAAVGGWVPTESPSNTYGLGQSLLYLFTKWNLDPSNRLVTTAGMPHSSP